MRVSSEVKQRSERSQRYHFSVAYARVPEELSALTHSSKFSTRNAIS